MEGEWEYESQEQNKTEHTFQIVFIFKDKLINYLGQGFCIEIHYFSQQTCKTIAGRLIYLGSHAILKGCTLY